MAMSSVSKASLALTASHHSVWRRTGVHGRIYPAVSPMLLNSLTHFPQTISSTLAAASFGGNKGLEQQRERILIPQNTKTKNKTIILL